MQKRQLQGTPSLILIDKEGRVMLKIIGQISDLQIGTAIGHLLSL